MNRIVLKSLSKKFRIGFSKKQSVLAGLIYKISGKEPQKTIWALKDISFEVRPGEFVGILGKNGSGKSTLLRSIAGIYHYDEGILETQGKVISLINLSTGLKEKLTTRDNIRLYGAFFNIPAEIVDRRINDIIRFAGLEEFADTKIYQLSSGMKQRLSFSIAIHCDPDVILLDEDFEMVDEAFRNKSILKIKTMVEHGAAVMLITHNLAMIKENCCRVLWLHQGRLIQEGETSHIIHEYLKAG